MQDIWASGVEWDDPVSSGYFMTADYQSYSSFQIHVFMDVSKSAYACIVSFRVGSEEEPEETLVTGKAKEAPLKMSIRRLELQAAILDTFRGAEILSTMHVQDWRKVDTELNVADLATKWDKGPNFERDNPWFRGPKFLWDPESSRSTN